MGWVEAGRRARPVLLTASLALLLAVGVLGPSAAKPSLGERGWAPGELPWSPGAGLVTGMLAGAYLLGAAAVALGLWRLPERPWRWAEVGLLAVAALLTSPFGSADHTNYAAYGRMVVLGGDPYLTSPADFGGADPVISAVEPPWTDTTSIYGPFATLLHAFSSWVGGDNLRQTVWVWQLVIVACWLGVRLVLLRSGADARRVDLLWTANPLVLGVGVLGAHVDLVGTALVLVAVAVAARSAAGAGLLAGLAVSTKVTDALVGVALAAAWWLVQRHGLWRRLVVAGLAALAVVVPLHLWAGPHVFEQLGRARRSVSLATPWRLLLEVLTGPMAAATVRNLIFVLSALLMLVLAAALWRLTRGRAPDTVVGQGLRAVFVLATAYAVGAPYTLPWYDQLTWATLPVLTAGALDAILLVRLLGVALAYVPGRVVGMTPRVESLTLGFRRSVAPYAVLAVWVALLTAWRRASRPRTGSRPRGSAPRSR